MPSDGDAGRPGLRYLTKLCHRSIGPVAAPASAPTVAPLPARLLTCIGRRCSLFVITEDDGDGACAEQLQAVVLNNIGGLLASIRVSINGAAKSERDDDDDLN